jgi:hypothetical protein
VPLTGPAIYSASETRPIAPLDARLCRQGTSVGGLEGDCAWLVLAPHAIGDVYPNFGGLGEPKATTRSGLRPKSTSPTIPSPWRQYLPQAA